MQKWLPTFLAAEEVVVVDEWWLSGVPRDAPAVSIIPKQLHGMNKSAAVKEFLNRNANESSGRMAIINVFTVKYALHVAHHFTSLGEVYHT